MGWFDFVRGEKPIPEPEKKPALGSLFSTDLSIIRDEHIRERISANLGAIRNAQFKNLKAALKRDNIAMDAWDDVSSALGLKVEDDYSVPSALIAWYSAQNFIGWQTAAIIAQNWLVNKACTMPGRDAVRKGYQVLFDEKDEDAELDQLIAQSAKRVALNKHMQEFIRKGRIFGVRLALFKVETDNPQEYYENPFNLDAVKKGSYKGIVQIDPYWTAPLLDITAASQYDDPHFYEPTWWLINGQKYHRSHFIIYRHDDPADILKPVYIYGGIPLPQQIMERVYAAERTANEAPQLAETKRTNVWLTDLEAIFANAQTAFKRIGEWARFRDNYGIKIGDKNGDEYQQFDTSLTDLDEVIMTQYQLVAAIAEVPSSKLLQTSPKGFNATGEFEEASYHESLESIQANDLQPLLERHVMLTLKSSGRFDKEIPTFDILWKPLDTMTDKELADVNYIKAQTNALNIENGILTQEEARVALAKDKNSGYEIDLSVEIEEPDEEATEETNAQTSVE